MRLFEIATPDGRRVRHPASDPAAAASKLMPGYTLAGEIIGADANMAGGFTIPAGQGESPLAVLLRLYGDDLHEWLRSRGFVKPDP